MATSCRWTGPALAVTLAALAPACLTPLSGSAASPPATRQPSSFEGAAPADPGRGARTAAPDAEILLGLEPSHPTGVDSGGLVMAGALSPQADEPDPRDEWRFAFAPYLWAANLKGKIGVNGFKGNVDASFSDVIDNLDYGFMGAFEARKGDAGAWLDVVHMVLSSDTDTPLGTSSVKLTHGFAELAGFHAIDAGSPTEVFAGLRHIWVNARVQTGLGPRRSANEEWTDLIVGLRHRFDINEAWSLRLRGDVGGFGLSDSSDLTYSGMARASYAFSESLAWTLGYRYMMVDYDGGSYTHDLRYQAMLTGLEFKF